MNKYTVMKSIVSNNFKPAQKMLSLQQLLILFSQIQTWKQNWHHANCLPTKITYGLYATLN